jgi:predicted unusual protein kinase regulating ubiquinone biosynthesis (AarF/ABC1/UbiB family)
MKTGQLLSLEFSDLLPPEITEILRTLHDSSTFMPFEQVEKILRKELGEVLFADLKNVSKTPISSASIGQVHSAELHGQKVAIKVQFPGVDKSIGADLALVRKAAESILWVQNKKVPLDSFFEECERVLKQEVDYKKEAKFSHKFGELVGDHEYYLVPKVFEDYSTRRVLILSFMEGQRLGDWLKSSRSEAENLQFAERILELLFLEFFEWGAVQTDPNFGNFLYRPETGQLVLLDFGACNFYTKKFRRIRSM